MAGNSDVIRRECSPVRAGLPEKKATALDSSCSLRWSNCRGAGWDAVRD